MADAQHRDLTSAFGAPAKGAKRAAGLAGILPPKAAPEAATAQDATTASAAPVVPTAAPKPKRPRATAERPSRAPRPEPKPADDPIVNLAVYLPEDLRAHMHALMPRGTRTTYADVLLEAFEGVTEERLIKYFTPTARTSASGVPLAPATENPGTGPQRQFRVLQSQLDWISKLAERVGAPSRSVVCVAALRLHLNDRDARGQV